MREEGAEAEVRLARVEKEVGDRAEEEVVVERWGRGEGKRRGGEEVGVVVVAQGLVG